MSGALVLQGIWGCEAPICRCSGTSWGHIGMVQVADVPGRIDLGAGTLDWPAIFAGLAAMRYTGLVEIEHEPMEEGPKGETALLARLEKFRGS